MAWWSFWIRETPTVVETDEHNLRIIKRRVSDADRKLLDSYHLNASTMIFEPQLLTTTWRGMRWKRLINLHTEDTGGICRALETAEKAVQHYALYGHGHEIVELYNDKVLRTRLALGAP